MTGRFDAAFYEDIRGRVRGVLIAVCDAFPPASVGIVDEMIDANEAGVALEMLIEMLMEARPPVSVTVVAEMERLVHDMDLSPEVAAQVRELKTE